MRIRWVFFLVWVLLIPEYWVPVRPEDPTEVRVGKWGVAGEFSKQAECEEFRATIIGVTSSRGDIGTARRFRSGMCLDKEQAQKYLSE